MKARVFSIFLITVLVVALFGYGGSPPAAAASSGTSSYIVQAESAEQAARLVESAGGRVTSRLEIINGVGAMLTEQALAALRQSAPTARVTQNQSTSASGALLPSSKIPPATDYPDVVGADMVWQADLTGEGIGVALVDSGVAQHPALTRKADGKHWRIAAWVDFVQNKKNPTDPNGHGTHLAGIIANAQIGADGEWNGMAPEVNLVGVRVLDKDGKGSYETVIKGIQWVIQNKDRYHIRVMNLSLQSDANAPYWADPLDMAVTRAWAEGIVVVTVAGNSGPKPMTINAPGNNPYAITVGAFTDNYTPSDWSDDYIAPFSAAGPTLDGFVKPDLMAPGAHMASIMQPGSTIVRNHDANWIDGFYYSMAGTSQAAAVVSGAIALMLQHNPSLTPDQVKYRLMVTALPWVNSDESDTLYSIWQQGAGRLNVYDAVLSDDPQADGQANSGMDIQADLNGQTHYEGYSYYDETAGLFRLRGTEDWTSGFGSWSGGFGSWSGGFGSWSGGFGSWSGGFGSWSGGFGSWSGGFGSWSGGFGSWSGGFGSWSGGFGSWSGGFGSWSGGFGSWSGGFGSWSGSVPWAGYACSDAAFVEKFLRGETPNPSSSKASVSWTDEP